MQCTAERGRCGAFWRDDAGHSVEAGAGSSMGNIVGRGPDCGSLGSFGRGVAWGKGSLKQVTSAGSPALCL